jgi:hypothetical protein
MAAAAAWDGPTPGELKAAGAEAIPGGVRVKGWVIQSHKGPILNSASVSLYEPLPTLNPNLSAPSLIWLAQYRFGSLDSWPSVV